MAFFSRRKRVRGGEHDFVLGMGLGVQCLRDATKPLARQIPDHDVRAIDSAQVLWDFLLEHGFSLSALLHRIGQALAPSFDVASPPVAIRSLGRAVAVSAITGELIVHAADLQRNPYSNDWYEEMFLWEYPCITPPYRNRLSEEDLDWLVYQGSLVVDGFSLPGGIDIDQLTNVSDALSAEGPGVSVLVPNSEYPEFCDVSIRPAVPNPDTTWSEWKLTTYLIEPPIPRLDIFPYEIIIER